MPNILVSTFGNTWAIAAELVAIGNYKEMNLLSKNKSLKTFYDKHTELDKIDEIWLICTHDKKTNEALNDFNTWLSYFQDLPLPLVRLLGLEKLEDLTTELECRQMSDFIYRTVLKAREVVCDGQLILSLAGGRKTMSSDMQRAADLFGCNALIHVANNNFPVRSPDDFKAELAEDVANELFIVEVQKNTKYNFVVDITPRITSADYPIEYSRSNKPSLKLYNEINERLSNAESLHYNAYRFRTGQSNQTIFHGLQQLPPVTLHKLENERPDYEWLKLLPKTIYTVISAAYSM
jgi:adenosine deaminase